MRRSDSMYVWGAYSYGQFKGGQEVALWRPNSFILRTGTYMILLTDPSRPNHDSFVHAMPQGIETWDFWRAAAAQHNSYVMGIAMAYRVDDSDKVDLLILLPDEHHTDEAVETAAAHLRVFEKYEGKIFVLRREPKRSRAEVMLAATGDGADIEELIEDEDMSKENRNAPRLK